MYSTQNPVIILKPKEKIILRMIADGNTSIQIADKLCLSLNTIKWYRKKLKARFETANTAQMIRKAMENGLL